MRSISEGKSSVTTFTLMPMPGRSCWIMVAMRSRYLLPALVTMENSTAWPSRSRSTSPCKWNPSCGKKLQCRLLIEGMRLQPGVEPELVGRRNRANAGLRVAAKDDARQIVAVDRLPKLRAGIWSN